MPQALFRRVQLRAVGRQRERHDSLRPDHFLPAMAPRSVEHDADPLPRPFLSHRRQKEIQTDCIHMRQQQAAAFAALRRHRDGHPDPFVPIMDDPRRAVSKRTPAAAKPQFQSEPPLVEGHDPRNGGLRQPIGELCLKAACAAASALT